MLSFASLLARNSAYVLVYFLIYVWTYGWAAKMLWAWFAVPYFHAPEVSRPVLVGLILLLGLAQAPHNQFKPGPLKQKVAQDVLVLFLKPCFSVLFGWLIVKFLL